MEIEDKWVVSLGGSGSARLARNEVHLTRNHPQRDSVTLILLF